MHPLQLKERVQRAARTQEGPVFAEKPAEPLLRAMRMENVVARSTPAGNNVKVRIKKNYPEAPVNADQRIQHELAEMRQTDDLRDVDDDVEDLATMYAWQALEHTHRPKSQRWFIVLAAGIAVAVGLLAVMGNIMGAITVGLVGGLTYYIAQHKPAMMRYRLMVDGVALNNVLYHYKDLESFNVLYEPGQVKNVLIKSKHMFSPYIHMEIGDADPVAMRDILLEFLAEDQDMEEPTVDVLARRLGF